MTDPYSDHPKEEALESFLLNRLPEAELEIVETHILACEFCIEQLESLEVLIAATKATAMKPEARQTHPQFIGASVPWKDLFSFPKLSLAGVFCAATVGAILFSVPREVNLSAYRGREMPIVSTWRPLRLNLNAADLAEGPIVVELVDNGGVSVWKGQSAIRNDQVTVTVPWLTKSGPYFVRLFSAAQRAAPSELLREFTFQAKQPLL